MKKPRISKITMPKLGILFSALLKIVFLAGYIGLCGLILSPQVDYQSWYPSQLGKHNFTLGIDFSEHKKAVLDFSEASLSDEQMTVIVQTIYKRASSSNLNDLHIEMNGSSLELHIPDRPEYDDSFIKTLLSQGKIEIKTPAEGVDLQSNLEMMFSEEGYSDTDIKQDKITQARLISQDEQYDYIEIVTDSEQINAWKSAAEAAGENNVNTMIDGNLNFSWILPPDDVQQKYPLLVLPSGRADIELIVEQLMNSPLPIEMPIPIISPTEALYPSNLLYAFITIFSMSVSIALSMKFVWRKQKLSSVIVLTLIILGLLTIVKLSPVTIGVAAMSILILICTAIASLEPPKHALVSTMLVISGICLTLSNQPSLHNIAVILTRTGSYTFLCFIICTFLKLYEQET